MIYIKHSAISASAAQNNITVRKFLALRLIAFGRALCIGATKHAPRLTQIDGVSEVQIEGEKELQSGIVAGLEEVKTVELVKTSFLDYAMSVIVARAIPDARDGLKPVHRRIIYSMNETGNTPDKPFKKCARIVGDVMGKYHPHGDAAIYGAVVRLAQDFAMRYPLVDGHGNFGSMDGDEAAAYRYTEARLQKLALEMVRDINANTVDFVGNYDGTEQEPVVLPSRFPNLLVNGSNGIAVGMATNIPPHNLGEVIDATIHRIDNPNCRLDSIMNIIKGPDFPTGGIVEGKEGMMQAYETGKGKVIVKAKTEIVNEKGKHQIVIHEIPYEVLKEGLRKKIEDIKNVPGIGDATFTKVRSRPLTPPSHVSFLDEKAALSSTTSSSVGSFPPYQFAGSFQSPPVADFQ